MTASESPAIPDFHPEPEDMSSIADQRLNVPYGDTSEAQKLDFFRPAGDGPFAAVVLIHGGAFRMGDRTWCHAYAKTLVKAGLAAIAISYRLSGEAPFPAAVHDCKAAIRWVRAHAAELHVDPGKIGTWGSSAGGYLSAMMGTSGGNSFADGTVGSHPDVSTRIQACIDWFGPIDFSTMVPQAKQLGLPPQFGLTPSYNVDNETRFLGAAADDPSNANLVARANPATYLDESAPPFWVEVGDQDPLIPYLQSQYFAEELTKVLGPEKVNFDVLKGAGHGGDMFESEANMNVAVSFLKRHLFVGDD